MTTANTPPPLEEEEDEFTYPIVGVFPLSEVEHTFVEGPFYFDDDDDDS